MSEPAEIPEVNGRGPNGIPIVELYQWLFTFMERSKDPWLLCGVYAYASIWSLSCSGQHAFRVDPKDADIIRTPYGPLTLKVCKSMAVGTVFVNEGEAGEMLSVIHDLQCILP